MDTTNNYKRLDIFNEINNTFDKSPDTKSVYVGKDNQSKKLDSKFDDSFPVISELSPYAAPFTPKNSIKSSLNVNATEFKPRFTFVAK